MINKGAVFTPGKVKEWMDCGNPKITLQTNKKMLRILTDEGEKLIADNITKENSEIIPPCYVGNGVVLKNTTVGPNVAIGEGSLLENSTISDCLIQKNTVIKNAKLFGSMIGNHVKYDGNHTL